MPRPSTKKVGALVELFRRKTKGFGMILEITDSKQILERYDPEWSRLYQSNKLPEKDKRLFQCYNYYDKWPQSGMVRKYAFVKWFKRPSEWENDEIIYSHDWYPVDLLRAVSSPKKS
tara:strand:+ start:1579 stop:1929 length:351 start_codon:yes stop_codon:yes gene_type:complete